MLRCISKNYPLDLPFYEQRTSFRDRKRLLSALLSCRDTLRVICAPALYGKSVLAYEYATQVFSNEEVRWIDARDPAFLLALDGSAKDDPSRSSRDLAALKSSGLLFVIDGCPYLEQRRFDLLNDKIEELLACGHEVVLTTDDVRWIETDRTQHQVIDARMLLLDKREQDQWSDDDPLMGKGSEKDKIAHDPLLTTIVGCRMCPAFAQQRLFDMLMSMRIHREDEALSILMVLLGSGALHELRTFTKDLSNEMIARIERRYPHAGITSLSPLFDSVACSNNERFLLARHHLGTLAQTLSFVESEESFIEALIDRLLKRKEIDLATRFVCGMHDESFQCRFFDQHFTSFLFAGKPLMLLRLAGAFAPSLLCAPRRKGGIVVAFAMLGKRVRDAYASHTDHDRSALTQDRADKSTHVSPRFVIAEQIIEVLAEILFNGGDEDDRSALGSLVASYGRLASQEEIPHKAKRPSITGDVHALLEQTLIDPCCGYDALERLASSGHSVKECLMSTALFLGLLLFMWRARLDASDPGTTRRPIVLQDLDAKESEMLLKLEGHIVALLARQAIVLPPNGCELYIFDKARTLFGDRMYLLVDDPVLNRIEAQRSDLIAQRKQYSARYSEKGLHKEKQEGDTQKGGKKARKQLRINTLGRFEIESYDEKITIKPKVRKQLRLLISLMAINNGREVARPWVQRVMWPDSPERNAKQNLYTMWSILNKSIIDEEGQCPFFESYPHSLSLNTQLVETDTQLLNEMCRRLREQTFDTACYVKALDRIEDIYRGPLLPGEETAEVVAHRKKYQDRLIEALLHSGEHLRKCGETALALRYLRFAFDTQPTREDVCYQLMLVLWKLGRQGEALNEYFVCRRSLIDTFGIEGSAKLRELYEAILHDVS